MTNPSGGLVRRGRPLGAILGLAQRLELASQRRDCAERRQVEEARITVAHDIGRGDACIVGSHGRAAPKFFHAN
ncbi:MAG: hypothetical protein AB7I32_19165 [Gammaproteobacteria bacterium]